MISLNPSKETYLGDGVLMEVALSPPVLFAHVGSVPRHHILD